MGGENLPPMGDGQMPMGNDQMMGDGQMPMDGEMPPQDGSEFNTNFDAGVNADEETDPKKYIQQLTGKLSQTLVSYNNELGEPDTELGKYVLGMLIKQGTKGMDEKEKKEIIKKINIDNNEETMSKPEDLDDENEQIEMPMESCTFNFTKKQIFEGYGIVMDDEVKKNEFNKKSKITPDTVKNLKTKPFQAPAKFN